MRLYMLLFWKYLPYVYTAEIKIKRPLLMATIVKSGLLNFFHSLVYSTLIAQYTNR